MKQQRIGLVGLGKLGTAMMTHWDKKRIELGVYHPVQTKAENFLKTFQCGYILTESELKDVDILILALPATEVIPFITSLKLESYTSHTPIIINMATNLLTKQIMVQFPDLQVHGVKYMGHSKDLLEHGNGLFITESALPRTVGELFHELGKVMVDSENCLTEVNKLATYIAIKTAITIETEFVNRGLSPAYLKRALTSLAPEVIRSYSEGSLGHFAKEIVKEVKAEKSSDISERNAT
ncbi:NAD(P)-binding domain-containing protein [Neobacillus sp. SuZ13]|uniref:NAD(P)-binding domain-containing protein n=1 Tax=Neobacillus sp. SuZ13 TaxID=3047875 RepID=UPI0024C0D5AD|nr:NAD(P)-binding domain-containing protein [Neobacillus sp. SuZ13]WHY64880.1 NAD(P)-binding domain-containing protein [Neobacillus sp. SuZ13]